MSEITVTIVNVTDYRTESVIDVIWRIASGQQQTTRFEGDDYALLKSKGISDTTILELLNRSSN